MPRQRKAQTRQMGVALKVDPPRLSVGFTASREKFATDFKEEVVQAKFVEIFSGEVESVAFGNRGEIQMEAVEVMGEEATHRIKGEVKPGFAAA